MRIVVMLAVLIVAAMAYIRLAPTDTARWHRLPDVDGPGDVSSASGYTAIRRLSVPASEALTALEQRALGTPRTVVFAGSIEEGLITFQTRSLLWGFPDYTTIGVQGDLLVIHGRLRFGKSDIGVNKARILGWLETLGPLTEPL